MNAKGRPAAGGEGVPHSKLREKGTPNPELTALKDSAESQKLGLWEEVRVKLVNTLAARTTAAK